MEIYKNDGCIFDCLNVKNPIEHKLKRKDARAPCWKTSDWRFRVTIDSCTY